MIEVTDELSPQEKMFLALTGKKSNQLSKKKKVIKFPLKLMYTLDCGTYSDIVSWTPSGLAFVIMNKQAFEKQVLPDIFKQAKMASFERKLKRWKFIKGKTNKGARTSCYGHPNFKRGDFSSCASIPSPGEQEEDKQPYPQFANYCSSNAQTQLLPFPTITAPGVGTITMPACPSYYPPPLPNNKNSPQNAPADITSIYSYPCHSQEQQLISTSPVVQREEELPRNSRTSNKKRKII